MEKVTIKCPVCGNNEFVKIDRPYKEGMDTYIEDYTQYCACSKCGLVLRFAKQLVDQLFERDYLQTDNGKKWSQLNAETKRLNDLLKSLEQHKFNLLKEKKDDHRTIMRDKQIDDELKQVKERIQKTNDELKEKEALMVKLRK